jgi:hypothetical protein
LEGLKMERWSKTLEIKVKDYRFWIRYKFKGLDHPIWDRENLHPHFKISIKNIAKPPSIAYSFDFWESVANKDKMVLSDLDIVYAVKMFFEDALSYADYNNIDDFAREFGYTKISEALNAYNGCKKALHKCEKIGLTTEDLREIVNTLIDLENEDKLENVIKP